MKIKFAYIWIIVGAALWGHIGIFVRGLSEIGFSALQIVTLRILTAAIILLTYVYFKDRKQLIIKLKDSIYFVGTGIFSIVFFSWCYFTAMEETSLTIAVILLYTAPAFVTILSRIIFKEYFTKKKLFSLLVTLIGIILVIGYTPGENISLYGLVVGLGSGFGYALYSIFGKAALNKYSTLTTTTYTFLLASIAIFPFSGLWRMTAEFNEGISWLYVIGLGLIPTALAYIFYTKGLSQIEPSRASITATVEPVVATLVGVLYFKESLALWQFIGILLVLTAVLLVQDSKEQANKVVNMEHLKEQE
ncbi:DMT family transporter [Alkaliphilus peptidifermentans]|uniref:Threonine/homoserine efflux transporter RhtA n=1 Tax=Alkaliphilus peptidifermentans DSM 18978 TaxID=1120976 RepID=A0A1G5BAZ5_9FIRM|nr:EamA family transporter [Alkaliphilus peptidifermentans]SCX87283.1 Threonine/homoserine efflux transporter RhtA [Alkaliphilus peptidifermentans DSM 18978]